MTLFGIQTFPNTWIHSRVDDLPVHSLNDQYTKVYLNDLASHKTAATMNLITHYQDYEYDYGWWFPKRRTAGILDYGFTPGGGVTVSQVTTKNPTLNYRYESEVGPFYNGRISSYLSSHSQDGVAPDFSYYKWQGWPYAPSWDKYVIVVDPTTATSYEYLAASGVLQPNLSVKKITGQRDTEIWPLKLGAPKSVGALSKISLTSSDAPLIQTKFTRTPVASGGGAGWVCRAADTIRIQEVKDVIEGRSSGIDHTSHLYGFAPTNGEFVWPSRGTDRLDKTTTLGPPHGSWLRLRDSYDITKLPIQAQIIAKSWKEHGIVLLDSAAHGVLCESSPVPKSKTDYDAWQKDALNALEAIPMIAFEFIDAQGIRSEPDCDYLDKEYWRATQ
jgi:hypothetical protein